MAITFAQKETIRKYFDEKRRISEICEIMGISRETIRKYKPKPKSVCMEDYRRMFGQHTQEKE